jgi:hypothetical protein
MGTDIHAFVEYADGGTSISGTPEWYLLGSFSLGPHYDLTLGGLVRQLSGCLRRPAVLARRHIWYMFNDIYHYAET